MTADLPGELDGKRFLRAMARLGWPVVAQRGSHRKLAKAGRPEFIIVAFHGTIGRNSVRHILRKAGIGESDFLAEL